jgi:hypothetical protein
MLMFVASPAAAQTIDFGALAGTNGSLFTGPYLEDGFSVSVLSGTICVAQVFGSPVPDLFGGSACSTSSSATLSVSRTGGGLFRFLGADLAANNGDVPWSFAGLVGAATTYVASGTLAENTAVFQAVSNPGSALEIDELRITLTSRGTSFNIDNLRMASAVSVPEPGSMALIVSGFFGLVGVRRRRQDVVA